MNAIPTFYNGTQFRSRLEARWAAFFDLLGWKWEYEPLDLSGYIPDFLITRGQQGRLVEVRPFTKHDWWSRAYTQIVETSSEHDFPSLIVSTPERVVAVDAGTYYKGEPPRWRKAKISLCESCGITVTHEVGCDPTEDCVFCDEQSCGERTVWEGKQHALDARLTTHWRMAGNLVQWKRPA